MAVLALGFAGQAIGASIGGSILGVTSAAIGGFIGSTIGGMIDNMLFLARAEQPAAAIERQRFALPALVEQLCDYFEGVAEERGIQLLDETEGELCGDPEQIGRASCRERV